MDQKPLVQLYQGRVYLRSDSIGVAARARDAVAEIVAFLWATLMLAFFGLIATGFLST
jgi:hypothetical protein